MTDNNEKIFFKSIKGVSPIKKSNKIKKFVKSKQTKHINEAQKTIKKEEDKTSNYNKGRKISNFSFKVTKANKMLKKGKAIINSKVDFHGKSLLESERIFKTAILKNYNNNIRCILFITGKGLYKQSSHNDQATNKNPKLFYGKTREAFLNWIKKEEYAKLILSTNKAPPGLGGDGAFIVYLRKKKSNL